MGRRSGSLAAAPEGETAVDDTPAWRVLAAYARPHWRMLLAGGGLSLATAASGLALPLVVRELIAALGTDRSVTGLVAVMTLLVVANAVVGALGGYVLRRTAESVVLTARRGLLSRLLRLRLSAVERHEPGDLMSRVTADTTLLREVILGSLVGGVTGLLTFAATLVLMAVLDLVMLAVTVAAVALAVVVVGLVVPRINRASRHAQDSVGAMGAALERVFGAFRTVKASGAEGREGQRLDAAAVQAWGASVRAATWGAVAGSAAGLAVQVAFVAVLSVGGARVSSGSIGIGTLVAFLLYVFFLIAPVGQLAGAVTQYHVGAAAVARIREVDALPVEPCGLAGCAGTPRPSAQGAASVTFEHVDFRYGPTLPPVLDHVDFVIPPRGLTAFVGPSGAGKSTVLSLVERFYECDRGRVVVDGTDVRDWSVASLRASIGYVEQDAPVLSGTLRDNLLFAAPDASEGDLHRVLQTIRLAAMVAALPDGLDTTVGHRGMKLSGGERQRVAIGRALLRRPRLLLLDEATSQLDAVNEAALREIVSDVARTTTVLVVAHRLSTVTSADRIVVMEAGRVRAVGTHVELVERDPLYRELAATQFLTTHLGTPR
ncbi:MAG: ABC transporter ATP-binding protein/permease [Actinomycetota bacterium]|nr:ABC transporter ATP-binding protein/permease [Actinomycetota bacterium]